MPHWKQVTRLMRNVVLQPALVPPAVLLSRNSVQSHLFACCQSGTTVGDDLESLDASDDLSQRLQRRGRIE